MKDLFKIVLKRVITEGTADNLTGVDILNSPVLVNIACELLGIDFPISTVIQNESETYNRYKGYNYFKEDPSDMFSPSSIRDSVEEVDPNDIIFTETGQSKEKIAKMGKYKTPEYDRYSTGYPIAFRYKNKIYLLDGHHRVTLAKQDNVGKIKVAIKDIKFDTKSNLTPQQKKKIEEESPEVITKSYRKAKADGSNPELVKAVEEVTS